MPAPTDNKGEERMDTKGPMNPHWEEETKTGEDIVAELKEFGTINETGDMTLEEEIEKGQAIVDRMKGAAVHGYPNDSGFCQSCSMGDLSKLETVVKDAEEMVLTAVEEDKRSSDALDNAQEAMNECLAKIMYEKYHTHHNRLKKDYGFTPWDKLECREAKEVKQSFILLAQDMLNGLAIPDLVDTTTIKDDYARKELVPREEPTNDNTHLLQPDGINYVRCATINCVHNAAHLHEFAGCMMKEVEIVNQKCNLYMDKDKFLGKVVEEEDDPSQEVPWPKCPNCSYARKDEMIPPYVAGEIFICANCKKWWVVTEDSKPVKKEEDKK